MPVTLHRHPPVEFHESDANCIHIGIVNNMPDAALRSTERQFLTLLDSASGEIDVRTSLYALPDILRAESGRRYVGKFYSSLKSLWGSHLDGLIVTGTEPRAAKLSDEPYWNSLIKLIEWGDRNTNSTILSCLSSHAALLHFDGIERRPLREKRFGLFDFSRVSDHPLTAGTPSHFPVPQSRWNEIPTSDLAARGYRILTHAEDAGVDMFVAQRKSLFVFFQGHPEYETNTLLFEYRRDVGRYLRHEREMYPSVPHGYFDSETTKLVATLSDQALGDRREGLLADFPIAMIEDRLKNTWRSAGASIYHNWLTYLWAQREHRMTRTRERGVRQAAESR
jgi:homoserine O-succinyltransferase/O-acetyltransferase